MTMLGLHETQGRRFLLWVLLALLAAVVAYAGFRGYFSPELLFNFSNAFTC